MQFDPEREIIIKIDLSGYVVGDLLSQYNNNNVFWPCAYFSKRNTLAEYNYEIYNKKLLIIICCLKKWDFELYNIKEFKIIINYKNLKYFTTM